MPRRSIPDRNPLRVDVSSALGVVGMLTKYLSLAAVVPAVAAVGFGEPVHPFLLAGALAFAASG